MNIHNVISYVHNFDLSDKFQVVFEAHCSSFSVIITHHQLVDITNNQYVQVLLHVTVTPAIYWLSGILFRL